MPIVRNYGILAAVDWNSFNWQAPSSEEDLAHSDFGFVKDFNITYTSLNFAHDLYPTDADGYYWGLAPQLWSKTLDKEKSKYVQVVFFKSKNWRDSNLYIVGLYAFPIFQKTTKPSPIPEIFPNDFEVNIKSLPKNIHLLRHFISLKNHPDLKKFLPKDKRLGTQGFNYLTKENVLKILDAMTALNSGDEKLKAIKFRLLKAINP
jgi:hypothetical protein